MNALAIIVVLSADGIVGLGAVLGYAALRAGIIDGTITVKAVPSSKRRGPQPTADGGCRPTELELP